MVPSLKKKAKKAVSGHLHPDLQNQVDVLRPVGVDLDSGPVQLFSSVSTI